MSDSWIWMAVGSALAGFIFAMLEVSLREYSRSQLESMLERINRQRLFVRIDRASDDLERACAVLRRAANMLLVVGAVLAVLATPPDDAGGNTLGGGGSTISVVPATSDGGARFEPVASSDLPPSLAEGAVDAEGVIASAPVLAVPVQQGGMDAHTLAAIAAFPGLLDPDWAALVVVIGAAFLWIWLLEVGLATSIADYTATRIVRRAAPLLPALGLFATPLAVPLRTIDEIVRRLSGAEDRDELEEELLSVVDESEREGQLGPTVRGMIENIVDFRTATVDEVMTPRIDIKGINIKDPFATIVRFVMEDGHSRFPVYDGDIDHLEGILYAKDLLQFVGRETSGIDLRSLLREALLVPESRRIADLLVDFQQRQVHMAIVLDEYGGTAGLVTIEDIVEEIVGDIRDEHDLYEVEEPKFSRNDDGSYDIDARYHIDDINDETELDLPESEDYDTVGGWLFSTLGRIPDEGELVRVNGFEVTVLQAEKTHINRMRIRVLEGHESAEPAASSGASS